MKKFFWISALCVGLSAAALFAAPVGAASADIRRGGACGALREEAEFCGSFTNEQLAANWRRIARSLRRVFLIGR